jgi:hypothetical protein
MSKILSPLPQITPPPNINSNAGLLTNIERFAALNPKDIIAMAVYFRAIELANDAASPLTNYDLSSTGATLTSHVNNLVQDAKTVFGNIPTGDLTKANLAIDWTNCKAVFATLSSDVDTLSTQAGFVAMRERPIDELIRIAQYLRLEIGE